MGFFARPNLDNIQFKQLPNSELTLSGQTQINTTSGLTLATGNTNNVGVIITASGASSATNNYALAYDSIENVIKLKELGGSSAGIYSGASPTTCTVGGLVSNTEINGCYVNDIIKTILVPEVYPTLTDPTISCFTVSCATTLMEIGTSLSISGFVCGDLGLIDSNFSGITDTRSSSVCGYTFDYFGTPGSFTPNTNICAGYSGSGIVNNLGDNNIVTTCVHFCDGVQPYDSNGGAYCSPYSASALTESKVVTGVYPWYWGTESSGFVGAGCNRPTACFIKDTISSGGACKVVGLSEPTLDIDFNSTNDDYIWFAIPEDASKTRWYVTASNNGDIAGTNTNYPILGENLFPEPELISGINSFEGCWSGQTYKIYISNYQTTVSTNMEIRNS